MPPIAELIQQGATNLWVFIPTAILLGALHGLEPGHSKTMMASFIIAVKGTMAQAALLGLSAALSHSLIVWALAAAALTFGNELIAEQAEPYFMLLSALVVIGVSIWMFLRTRADEAAYRAHLHAPHGDNVNPGHGDHGHSHGHDHHAHHHEHHHLHDVGDDLPGDDGNYQDAHELAHAEDIKRRFVGQKVTTGQIALFGLTGGLVPCPASVTIMMICLHLKQYSLGAVMVASFSLGLAISLVSVGVIAAWGAHHVDQRLGKGRFADLARKMPYFSSALMGLVGLLMGTQALRQLV
jgi:ABC-type nickel/cobalt efflux system permease component RcnA